MTQKRIVFFSTPATGHLNAVYPVLARLVQKGMQIDWYCTEAYRPLVEATGARFVPYRVDFSRYPLQKLTADFYRLYQGLLELNRRCYRRHRREIEENPPALILYDSMCSFGKNLARKYAIPSICLCTTLAYNAPVVLCTSLLLPTVKLAVRHLPKLLRLYGEELRFRRREGLARLNVLDLFVNAGDKTLVFTPRALQPFVFTFPSSFVFVGTTIRDRIALTPTISYPPYDIYLSLGSIFSENAERLEHILSHPLFWQKKVIVSAGTAARKLRNSGRCAKLACTAHTEQLSLLPKVGLFVNHGGLNSVYESLYFGIFQICLPQQEEQKLTALLAQRKKFGLYVGEISRLKAAHVAKLQGAWQAEIRKYQRLLRACDGTARACCEILKLLASTGYFGKTDISL